MAEQPRSQEAENNPESAEKVADNAITEVISNGEWNDAADSDFNAVQNMKEWLKDKFKEEWENSKAPYKKAGKFLFEPEGKAEEFASGALWFIADTFIRFKLACFMFTKKLLQKGGKMTFGEGYEIGKEVFSHNKKGK